jgi:hypothetical protein
MTKKVLKLALEALEGVLDDAPKVLDASIAGGLYEVLQCRDAITAIKAALAQPEQEPVVLKWQQAPIRTAWGDDMVVASIAIDNDHTLSLYCERDQTPKVDVMFAQRTWVSLTDEEREEIALEVPIDAVFMTEAKLRSKNNG